MTLYELTDDYLHLLELAEEPDIDEQVFIDTLEGIEGALEDKAENYAKLIKQLESDNNMLKAEIDRLDKRKKSIEKNIERMTKSLEMVMIATNKRKFKTNLFNFSICKTPASVVIDTEDIFELPQEYLKYSEPTVDKAKLKKFLKQGNELEGIAHLESKEELRIK